MPREFDIVALMNLCHKDRYATTVAGFEVIDLGEQIEVSRKMAKRKVAVKTMHILTQEMVKWDFISEEKRHALRQELGILPVSVEEEIPPETPVLSSNKVIQEEAQTILKDGDTDTEGEDVGEESNGNDK